MNEQNVVTMTLPLEIGRAPFQYSTHLHILLSWTKTNITMYYYIQEQQQNIVIVNSNSSRNKNQKSA